MLGIPNYNDPCYEEYLELIDDEAYYVQLSETHREHGFIEEAKAVNQLKTLISIRRRCLKAAIVQARRNKVVQFPQVV